MLFVEFIKYSIKHFSLVLLYHIYIPMSIGTDPQRKRITIYRKIKKCDHFLQRYRGIGKK